MARTKNNSGASPEGSGALRISDPIEFLYGEHDRQLVICAALDHLATAPEAPDARETAELILNYADTDMPLHLRDEEEDLFPRLLERCEPEDGLENLVDQLEHEHETDSVLYQRFKDALHAIANGKPLDHPDVFKSDAEAFAALQRRHLNWENGTVLPLARQRLTPEDLEDMRVSMAARRHGSTVG